MRAPLLLVTGTGTEIGKTVVARGLVAAWASRDLRVAGLKPVESGRSGPDGDVEALAHVATFHVTHSPPPYLLRDPVSPHLAARREGRVIEVGVISTWVDAARASADGVVVELPGGLFSPLSETATNADAALALGPTRVVLVAPDRLGVLHDAAATVRAARAAGLVIDGLVLSAPAQPDASTGTNARELARVLSGTPILAVLPRAPAPVIAALLAPVLDTLGLSAGAEGA